MIDGKFDVIFRGQTVKGIEPDIVKDNLVQLFKSSRPAIDKLFSGSEVTIKKDLEYAAAMKYQAALRKAGALALIKEVGQAEDSQISESETSNSQSSLKSQYSGKASFGATSEENEPVAESTPHVAVPVVSKDSTTSSQLQQESSSEPQQTVSSDSDQSLTVAEVGADILPPKVYEKREVDTSELSMAPAGERIMPPKAPDKEPPLNLDHLSLSDD